MGTPFNIVLLEDETNFDEKKLNHCLETRQWADDSVPVGK